MKTALLFLGLVAVAMASTTSWPDTTRHPHNSHGDPLKHLVRQEVKFLKQQDPTLDMAGCTDQCDAIFNLGTHHNEHLLDNLCYSECKRALHGHHGHHTSTSAPWTT